jgi:methylmalonyl-CoA mutase
LARAAGRGKFPPPKEKPPTMAEFKLAAEFPPASRDDWRALVDKVLKGAPFDRLVSHTYDDLRIEPLYGRAPQAQPIAGRAAGTPWQILQRVDHPDATAANAQALQDLEGGATGLSLVFRGSIGAHGFGLAAAEAVGRALDQVYLDAGVAFELDLSPQTKDAPFVFAEMVKAKGIDPAKINVRFGFDPIGAVAAQRASPLDWDELSKLFAKLTGGLKAQGFARHIAVADGRVVHNAGGSEAQELAFTLACAVAYLRALEANGIVLDDARRMIFFRLSADADQFLTMAKFRALRKLWARVEEASGLALEPIFISAETAWRMMTQRDPHVNMLRTTMATAAAGFGGADSITVLPFTSAIGLPDHFARRIARNTQLILLDESNLAKVADPAAGSGGIEDLTAKLCAAAWSLLQEIEQAGGVWAALQSGLIQREVADVRAEREKAVAHRKDAITGTSEFPNLNEVPVDVIPVARVEVQPLTPAAVKVEPLRSIRLAEPFERLRDAADAAAKKGKQPKIFLANLGTPADFTERATFAKNLFEAGGIEAITNDGSPSADTAVAMFKNSGAKLACICGSNDAYKVEAGTVAEALKSAGAAKVWLAGKPDKAGVSGVDGFVYAGCDAIAALRDAHDTLGIAQNRNASVRP